MSELVELQNSLGVSFDDLSLLEQALVHSSYVNENPGFASVSNERLEFLGDAVLGLVIAEELYLSLPLLSEGEMTRVRAILVRRDSLARLARSLGLGNFVYLGKGEEASGGRRKPRNLASTLEAVVAAIFLDQGLVAARDFIVRLFADELNRVFSQGIRIDYKSQLQEFMQARQQSAPVYEVVAAEGPAHDMKFTVEVRLGDTVLGRGSGKSKKMAEAEAAYLALQKFGADFTP